MLPLEYFDLDLTSHNVISNICLCFDLTTSINASSIFLIESHTIFWLKSLLAHLKYTQVCVNACIKILNMYLKIMQVIFLQTRVNPTSKRTLQKNTMHSKQHLYVLSGREYTCVENVISEYVCLLVNAG